MHMLYAGVDWLVLWKRHFYPNFVWTYVLVGLPLRIPISRRLSTSAFKAWILSVLCSPLPLLCAFVVVIPSFLLVGGIAGRTSVYSWWMAIPIAISLGMSSATLDTLLFRFILREKLNKNRLLLLLGANTVIALLAISFVVAKELIHPTEMIA
jgi:hypothetical protein